MLRFGISALLIVTLIYENGLLCESSNIGEMWTVGLIVGVGNEDSLFHLTDVPVIISPNKQYYLSVQAQPAFDPLNPAHDEFFCWLAVVNQTVAANKTNIWRAPCDHDLERSYDPMQECFFGLTSTGSLVLSHEYSDGPVAFSSNTTGLNVDHAVVNNSGSLLLQTASNVTVWTSADVQTPTKCLGLLDSFNHTLRVPTAKPPALVNTTVSPPPANSGFTIDRHGCHVLTFVCILIFAL
ncbi:hypothetical protein R1flu_004378 [Riccia fluitans]|uniref:Bulb-type lectin domain-containing protein n=1 Tax=Riccia fluitans TaxID=41844 RepID=A0ABD1YQ39_9MARC